METTAATYIINVTTVIGNLFFYKTMPFKAQNNNNTQTSSTKALPKMNYKQLQAACNALIEQQGEDAHCAWIYTAEDCCIEDEYPATEILNWQNVSSMMLGTLITSTL